VTALASLAPLALISPPAVGVPFELTPDRTFALWVALGLLALLGKPLFAVIAATGLLLYAGAGQRLELLVNEMATIADQPIFVTIPLFVFAGTLLAESKAPRRLVDLARALCGWLPGGLAVEATVTCAFFTAVTGASGVTIIALGGLLYPMLARDGYPERFSIGLLTTGGSLGLLFVPSLPIIVYGLIAGVDIDTLFLAALLPGILLVVVLSGFAMIVGVRAGVPRHPAPWRDPAEAWRAFRAAAWEAPIPILIMGVIYSGAATAIEASAVVALYCLFVEVVVYRDVGLGALPRVARHTAELVGAILLILGMAMGLKNYLVDAEVPQQILRAMSTHIDSRLSFLIVLNLFLLVVGCLLDIFSAILVVVPLVAPLAAQFGVDPVHLAIIFLTNLEIGYLTPPVGINLFLGSLRFERPVLWIARAALPFLLLLVVCLAGITYLPILSTSLVDAVRGAPTSTPVDQVKPDGLRVRHERWVGRDGKSLIHGRYEAWFANGRLRDRGHYRFDYRHTIESGEPWASFHPDGSKKSEGHYRLGKEHGDWTLYHPNGAVQSQGPFVNGKKHGYWREWTEDGVRYAEGEWKDGRRDGPWIDWLDDERKLFEGQYRDDKPDGRWRQWSEETGERLPDKLWRQGEDLGEAPPE
jgi:tripartite ATP-independent transporter DctM subunit